MDKSKVSSASQQNFSQHGGSQQGGSQQDSSQKSGIRFGLRPARLSEKDLLTELIEQSVRGLSINEYSSREIEGALRSIFGVDTELITDGTYYTVEAYISGAVPIIAACGGWSKRKTLFGGDQFDKRESEELNPATDAAKIRAFFVHPTWARRGIGTMILEECERAAKAHGFTRLELMATLPGEKLYRHYGFESEEPIRYDMGKDGAITFVPMKKQIA